MLDFFKLFFGHFCYLTPLSLMHWHGARAGLIKKATGHSAVESASLHVTKRKNHKNNSSDASQLPFLSRGPVFKFVFTPEVKIAESLLMETYLSK